jgi:hypothetical protein
MDNPPREPLDFPTKGKVIAASGGNVVFQPRGTSYEFHLKGDYTAALNAPVAAVLRGKARKVYTVPSGGNFTTPIQGPPRIIQGWVLYADERTLIVHAGGNFIVDLPTDDAAISLDEGQIAVNKIVNVTLMPGATFELAGQAAAAA